ncbi:restriction endonuclease subunit S [Dietzia psychralcaliphila]|uniref:restriction endonuclease subunit S n=1 Tax=Dietzia psychralcaliphila TaxID=139021 RepID=UPI001C1DDAF9|nr:restriction endonuclease subunit S [Dietzia psychralcaliphila]
MNNFSCVELARVGNIITGSTPPKSEPTWFASHGVPFITPTDIIDGHRRAVTGRYLSEEGVKGLASRLIPPNTACFVAIGSTIGKICFTGEAAVTNQQIHSVVVDENSFDPRFVYYSICTLVDQVRATASGSATPIVNKSHFGKFQIPKLPISEQRRIGATLGTLDDKIESNRRQIATIFRLVESIGEAESKKIPPISLESLAVLNRKSSPISQLEGSLVDHYSLPAFDNGAYPVREMADGIKSNKIVLNAPCVLVPRLNPKTQRTWWVNPSPEVVSLSSTEFAVLEPKTGTDLSAVWLAVIDKDFQERMRASVTGTSGSHQRVAPLTVMGLEVSDFRAAEAEVINTVADLLNRTHMLKTENSRLAALRDSLLPELLSGRVRASEIEDAVEEGSA